MRARDLLVRWKSLLSGALGGFSAATICWFLWGFYFTPGDYFANGSPWVNTTLVISSLAGAGLAYMAGPWLRGLVVAISLLCAAFWIFTRDGWWVTPPPYWFL